MKSPSRIQFLPHRSSRELTYISSSSPLLSLPGAGLKQLFNIWHPYQFFTLILLPVLSAFSTSHTSSSFTMTNLVEVRVGLHCDDCIKKILKAVKKIEDIETYNVDTKLNKVIVTGNVTTEEVIRVLHKIGKNATPWDQHPQPNC